MNIPEDIVTQVADALYEHDTDRMHCGEWNHGRCCPAGCHDIKDMYAHAARAALSAAAPTLMAMAWDEGFSAAWQERANPDPFVNDEWDAKTDNPYRKEQK